MTFGHNYVYGHGIKPLNTIILRDWQYGFACIIRSTLHGTKFNKRNIGVTFL